MIRWHYQVILPADAGRAARTTCTAGKNEGFGSQGKLVVVAVGSRFVTEKFDRYLIRAGVMGGKCVARAFNLPPLKTTGIVDEASADTLEQAIEKLKQSLIESKTHERAKRRQCKRNHVYVPTVSEYRHALRSLPLSQAQLAMLCAHGEAGSRGLASHRIAAAGGYRKSASANALYGAVGRLFADFLQIENLPTYSDSHPDAGKTFATSALGHQGEPEDGLFVWVMHQELRQALIDEGLVTPRQPDNPASE